MCGGRHRITSDVEIVIDARSARLKGGAGGAVNHNLVRTPSDSMRCIADGLVGVDAETDRTARLSPEDFGTLLFEHVALAQLTTLVKEPACH